MAITCDQAPAAFAQTAAPGLVNGTITDTKPLAGAAVVLNPGNIGTTTDRNGAF